MPLYDGVRWGTSLLGRHFALAGSVALHVVVGAVAGGHAMAGGETAEGANAPLLVEIESLVTPATPLNGKGPDDPREAHELARAHPHPTHKHDYPVPAGHDEWPHDPSIVHMASAETSEVLEEPSAESSLPQPAVETPVRFVLARSTAVTGHEGLAVGHGTAGASAVEEAIAESRVSFPARIAATVPVIYPPEARAAEDRKSVV